MDRSFKESVVLLGNIWVYTLVSEKKKVKIFMNFWNVHNIYEYLLNIIVEFSFSLNLLIIFDF